MLTSLLCFFLPVFQQLHNFQTTHLHIHGHKVPIKGIDPKVAGAKLPTTEIVLAPQQLTVSLILTWYSRYHWGGDTCNLDLIYLDKTKRFLRVTPLNPKHGSKLIGHRSRPYVQASS